MTKERRDCSARQGGGWWGLNAVLVSYAQMRLGWFKAWPEGKPSKCPCEKKFSDLKTNPTHPLHCNQLKRRTINFRHDGIVQSLAAVYRLAGCSAVVEPASCFPGSNAHPDLKIVAGFETYMIDVTVRSPIAPSYAPLHPEEKQGALAERGEQDKNRMYEKQCNDKGWHFVPAAFEVFGLFGKKNKELLAILDKTCEDVVAPARLVKKMWMQACSTALARGNYEVLAEGRARTDPNVQNCPNVYYRESTIITWEWSPQPLLRAPTFSSFPHLL